MLAFAYKLKITKTILDKDTECSPLPWKTAHAQTWPHALTYTYEHVHK